MKIRSLACSALVCALAHGVFAQETEPANPSLRTPRSFALSGEVGANSLSSIIGPVFTWMAHPHMPLDFGLGLSATGFRPGIRARYLLTDGKLAPFVSGGFKYGLGTSEAEITVKNNDEEQKLEVKADPSPFIDLGVGLDYQAHNGFLFMAHIGYSLLLGGTNWEVTGDEAATSKSEEVLDMLYGSGVQLAVSFGKSF